MVRSSGRSALRPIAHQLASACVVQPHRRQNSPLPPPVCGERPGLSRRPYPNYWRRCSQPRDATSDAAVRPADNYHIDPRIWLYAEIRQDLPKGTYRGTPHFRSPGPRLSHGLFIGPGAVIASDGELDELRITRYVQAFRGTFRSLPSWRALGLPTMLRLVLIENLRRLAAKMLWGWDERTRAERGRLGRWPKANSPTARMTSEEHFADLEGSPREQLTDPFYRPAPSTTASRPRPCNPDPRERLEKRLEGPGADANEGSPHGAEHRRRERWGIIRSHVRNCVI